MTTSKKTTDFGFKKVASEQKESLVKGVFNSVASKYDIMNDAMSFGVHHLWKNALISMMGYKQNAKLLDVAGGTGDISFRFLKKFSDGYVTTSDINEAMLVEGRNRAINKNIVSKKRIEWLCGNAEQLPVPDNYYDFYTISFGIRNVTNINKALEEANRVLKPGGRFLCLEFSQVDHEILAKFYDFYSFNIIPKIGQLIAGDKESYQYLVESIRKFPPKEKFKSMIEQAGFSKVSYRSMTAGAVAIHSGWKI
jgi:ubiquinone/menaquinone biosynthesis methyltransferase